jgi:MFS family permease
VQGHVTYLGEIRSNWRYVAAASIGQAAGYSIVTYINNIFAVHLLEQFGWSRSAFALVGATLFLGVLIQPITGRLADSFGVRHVALVGVIGGPLVFLGLSLMTGDLSQFLLLTLMHLILTSGATGPLNYSRLVAKNLNRARGVSLAIAASTTPLVAAVCIPFLSHFIDANGWRAGYIAVAATTAIAGPIALILIPSGDSYQSLRRVSQEPSTRDGPIMRSRPLRLLLGGVFLCMLSFTLQTTQLKVILLDRGIDSTTGSLAISLFASGAIVGRLLCGILLDRFPAYAVAAVFLGLPGVGLSVLAAGVTATPVIAMAVTLLGLSLGAEGDVWAYLVARYFRPEIYGTVLGLVFSAMSLSTGLGALLLSIMLKLTGGFAPFLVLSAVSVFVGSGLLTLLGREPHAVGLHSQPESLGISRTL